LAYLHRMRGDASASSLALEESALECGLAEDPVGVEIARCLLASIACEEGDPQAGASQLIQVLSRFESLAASETVTAAGRNRLARRWLENAQSDLARAYLGCGDTARARPLVEQVIARQISSISARGLLYAKCIEARLLLAENRVPEAKEAIEAGYRAVEDHSENYQGDLNSSELGAAITAMSALGYALMGDVACAGDAFRNACDLNPDLHNRRAQAWSWGARAILARGTGDRGAALEAIRHGLALVQRSGAPIRRFLLELQEDLREGSDRVTMSAVRDLVCRFGD
jgi:tetratricopeptide (TPR) repeat protein